MISQLYYYFPECSITEWKTWRKVVGEKNLSTSVKQLAFDNSLLQSDWEILKVTFSVDTKLLVLVLNLIKHM